MQRTSLDVYFRIVLPSLSRRQQQVMDVFFEYPDRSFTNAELARALKLPINCVTPRTLELRKHGLLRICGRRECSVTRNNANALEVAE